MMMMMTKLLMMIIIIKINLKGFGRGYRDRLILTLVLTLLLNKSVVLTAHKYTVMPFYDENDIVTPLYENTIFIVNFD